jgi:molybdenum cofactor cytidylyltransferase
MSVVGVVLAAGASTRLGRRKQLELIGGEPLLARTVRMALASQCTRVGVVIGAHSGEVTPAVSGFDVDVIDNPAWAEGMASSIRTGVAWAETQDCDGVLVMVCDQPHLETGHLDELIARFTVTGAIVGSEYAGTVGVPAVFPRSELSALAALTGDRGARGLLRGQAAIPWEAGAIDLDE